MKKSKFRSVFLFQARRRLQIFIQFIDFRRTLKKNAVSLQHQFLIAKIKQKNMHSTLTTALLTAVAILALIFVVRAIYKVSTFSHHHYRITGDEVRNTNEMDNNIL